METWTPFCLAGKFWTHTAASPRTTSTNPRSRRRAPSPATGSRGPSSSSPTRAAQRLSGVWRGPCTYWAAPAVAIVAPQPETPDARIFSIRPGQAPCDRQIPPQTLDWAPATPRRDQELARDVLGFPSAGSSLPAVRGLSADRPLRVTTSSRRPFDEVSPGRW